MREFEVSSGADGHPAAPKIGRLEARLRAGGFAVVCEMSPSRGASLEPLRRKAALVRDWVDAAVITDGQGAQVRMAGWAGALALMSEHVEPILLVQARDRNRLAIQADLLGAAGTGVANVLLQSGDRAAAGDQPDAAESFDLDALGAIRAATAMKENRRLLSGRELSRAPHWFIGAVENATAGGGSRAARLAEKIAAGAQFVLTQYVFDPERLRDWMRRLRDKGLNDDISILPGVGPVFSPESLAFLKALPDVYIPEPVERRLKGLAGDRFAAEGLAIAVETLQAVREEPGVAGAYLLASNSEEHIPELLIRSGLRPPEPLS